MTVTCTLTITYNSSQQAQKILQALKVDDEDYITTTQKEKTVQVDISGPTLASIAHSLDDYLACLTVAEKIVNNN